jgi:hypothetical protein
VIMASISTTMKSLKEVTGQVVSVVWHYWTNFSPLLGEKFFNDYLRIDTKRFLISVKWNSYMYMMSLFTLGSARAVLVVALVYSFPDVFNVIMALISTYTNQPFIVPIRRTSIVSWDYPSQWRHHYEEVILK